MGRGGSGVRVRDKSIQIGFTLDGRFQRHTLMLNGKPMAPTAANVKHAHRVAAEIREKIKHGIFVVSEYFGVNGTAPTSVAAQIEAWLSAQRIEASTLAGYTSAAKFWKAAIGDKLLRALKPSDILTVLAGRPDLSGKTINNYVSVLREACALAVLDRVIAENPVGAVPRAKHQKAPADPFTREEVELIVADMRQHYPEPVAAYVEFAFFTGMRTSELAGLQWGSVGLRSKVAVVSEALVRGQAKDNTKTNVEREVMLNSRAMNALRIQKPHSFLAGAHVWLDPRYGTPWNEERAFRRSYWTPTLKRLGIRYRRPYCMRHTYATMMLMAGRPPAWCARQLGHSVEVFLRTYARWLQGGQDDAEMRALENWIAGPELDRNWPGSLAE
jgi:integrase